YLITMKGYIVTMNIEFFEKYFKFLFLSFWAMIWYELVFVSDAFIKTILVSTYCIITSIYIFSIIFIKRNIMKNITLYYRVSILCSFISTLFSLLLFPTSIFFLILKIIFILICLYFSYTKLFKYKIEEGLVGMLSSILLLIITFCY
ncbi:hypothetical protein, partial [Romboutsia sp. 13368]|uniref:hypothetical protein n=1 Tax=Romboutsia sp. 13368 TaxID=2708053 RepID=UPI0025DFE717